MSSPTQENRLIAVETPLGKDVLLLTAFTGEEAISRLFRYELEMLSEQDAIAASKIVGKNVDFQVRLADGTPRFFNGFVARFSAGSRESGLRAYRAEVVPWLWFLTRTADCRIFQNKSVPEIVAQVFDDLGFSDFETGEVKGSHPKREYCVQYRETDFDFVSRLLEEEGIFYFFRHEQGKHQLVLGDQAGAHRDLPEKEVQYEYSRGSLSGEDRITEWEQRWEFVSGKWAQTDYNFEDHPPRGATTPSDLLMTNASAKVAIDKADKFEVYDYPGRYGSKGDGKELTRVRIEETEAAHEAIEARSTCKTFSPGGKFKLARHDRQDLEGKGFVVTAIRHWARQPSSLGGSGGGGVGEDYGNAFTCIPDSTPLRPPRVTSKPYVRGSQTAVVTGPAGEEIWPDKYGRVKVQFFWDREGKRDENTSCWVRCAHPWAGKNWGAVAIPRIGMEVVVSFLEGDPDRPLVTGVVYNADYMPPYALPGNKTQTGIKTRSSKGGGEANFNEIRFEDKKGQEQLYLHAEKNQDIEVENDETHWVGHDRKKTIDNDETTHVRHDRTETVDRNETIAIGNDRSERVAKNETIFIGQNRTETVGKDESISIGGSRSSQIGKDESISVAGGRDKSIGKGESVSVGESRSTSLGKNENLTVGENRGTKVGKDDSLSVGKVFTLTAGTQITLKAGKASLTMKKDGTIVLQGKDITLKGSGQITGKASKNVVLKGQKILEN